METFSDLPLGPIDQRQSVNESKGWQTKAADDTKLSWLVKGKASCEELQKDLTSCPFFLHSPLASNVSCLSNHWCYSQFVVNQQENRSLVQIEPDQVNSQLQGECSRTGTVMTPTLEMGTVKRVLFASNGFSGMILLGRGFLFSIKTFQRFFLKAWSLSTGGTINPWKQRPSLPKNRIRAF